METLSRDMKILLASYLSLRDKRNLLQVSKWCYWWMKPYLRITTVPSGGRFAPGECVICDNIPIKVPLPGAHHDDATFFVEQHASKARLNTRAVWDLEKTAYAECERGHRFICHKKDGKFFNCPKCNVKRIKLF
jgi:hypothetical protein